MLENPQFLFFQLVQLVSRPTDQLVPFIKVQKEENFSFLDQLDFLQMNSLKMKIIKKFKKQFSNGF
jgi:hypothetical protein